MIKLFIAALSVWALNAQAAETYKVDTAESSVSWKGSKKMGDSHNGAIAIKEGHVVVDKNALKSGEVTVDMKTISNADLQGEWNKKLVGHLSSEDFFNVNKNPTSTFKITNVTMKSKNEALIKGDFTMIGKTHPVEFPMTVAVTGGVATGTGTAKIDRTKWGLKYGSGSIFKELTADKVISDEFELTLKIVAKK